MKTGRGSEVRARHRIGTRRTWRARGVEPLEARLVMAITPAGPVLAVPAAAGTAYVVQGAAIDPNGDVAVLYNKGATSDPGFVSGVFFVQRFDPTGKLLGGEIALPVTPAAVGEDGQAAGDQGDTIALTASGGLIVAWDRPGGSTLDGTEVAPALFVQSYDASGNPIGQAISVPTSAPTASQLVPFRVIAGASGGFALIYALESDSSNGLFAQVFDANGHPVGGPIAKAQDLTQDGTGRVVVATGGPTSQTWLLQAYDSSGHATGSSLTIPVPPNGLVTAHATSAMLHDGFNPFYFLNGESGGVGLDGQIQANQTTATVTQFNAKGQAIDGGLELPLPAFAGDPNYQGDFTLTYPYLATDGRGHLVAAWNSGGNWTDPGPDEPEEPFLSHAFVQRYDLSASPATPSIAINSVVADPDAGSVHVVYTVGGGPITNGTVTLAWARNGGQALSDQVPAAAGSRGLPSVPLVGDVGQHTADIKLADLGIAPADANAVIAVVGQTAQTTQTFMSAPIPQLTVTGVGVDSDASATQGTGSFTPSGTDAIIVQDTSDTDPDGLMTSADSLDSGSRVRQGTRVAVTVRDNGPAVARYDDNNPYTALAVYSERKIVTASGLEPDNYQTTYVGRVGFYENIDDNPSDGTLTFNRTLADGSGGAYRYYDLSVRNDSDHAILANLSLKNGTAFSLYRQSSWQLKLAAHSTSTVRIFFDPPAATQPSTPSDTLTLSTTLTDGTKLASTKIALKGNAVPPTQVNLVLGDAGLMGAVNGLITLNPSITGFDLDHFHSLSDQDQAAIRSRIEADLKRAIVNDVELDYKSPLDAGAISFSAVAAGSPPPKGTSIFFVDQYGQRTVNGKTAMYYGRSQAVDVDRKGLDDPGSVLGRTLTPSMEFTDELRLNKNPNDRAAVYFENFLQNLFTASDQRKSIEASDITVDGFARMVADTAAHELGHLLGLVHEMSPNNSVSNIITAGQFVSIEDRYQPVTNLRFGITASDAIDFALGIPNPNPRLAANQLYGVIDAISRSTFSNLDIQDVSADNFTFQGVVKTVSDGYASILPDGASSVTLAEPDPAGTSVISKQAIDSGVSSLQLSFDALSNKATLTPGHHLLQIVVSKPGQADGTVVAQVDLADLLFDSDANPLGQSSGWTTLDTDETDALMQALQPGQSYQVQVRLVEVPGAPDDEKVAVALGSLATPKKQPWLYVGEPDGSEAPPSLTFGPDASGSAVIPLAIHNAGEAPLTISSLALDGTGLVLAGTPALPRTLAPGESFVLQVRPADPKAPADGTLRIGSDDPLNPTSVTTLHFDPTATSQASNPTPVPPTPVPPPPPVPPVPPPPPAPATHPDAYTIAEGGTLSVATSAGVLANDSSPSGMPLLAAVVEAPAHGSLALAPDGSFTYVPAAGFIGADSFTYVAGDGQSRSAPVVVALTVAASPGPAPAGEKFATTLYADLLGRAPDADGLAYWEAAFQAGTSPARIARAFLASPEHRSLVRHGLARRVGLRAALGDALRAEATANPLPAVSHPAGPRRRR